MTYPEMVCGLLDQAIAEETQHAKSYEPRRTYRNRKVTREGIIKFLIYMEGGSLQSELLKANLDISPSALIRRRKQICSMMLQDTLANFAARFKDYQTYQGYRVVAVDGSCLNLAKDPSAPTFVRHAGAPEGYNQLKITALYDVLNKCYLACEIQTQPEQDEIGALDFLLTWYDFVGKILIVGDRLYSSYNLFATIQANRNTDFLIRVKQGKGAMKCVKDLPMKELDVIVNFTITTSQSKADRANAANNDYVFIQTRKGRKQNYSANTRNGRWSFPSPYPMTLRIVRIFLEETGEYETLATSLPQSFTSAQIKELYHSRWGIETAFRELKYTCGLKNLHGRSEEFARQEVYASMIMTNLCSKIVSAVVVRQPKGPVYQYKVNQKRAMSLCKKFLRTPGADGEKLMRDIARFTEPIRPGRRDTRNLRVKTWEGFVYRVAA